MAKLRLLRRIKLGGRLALLAIGVSSGVLVLEVGLRGYSLFDREFGRQLEALDSEGISVEAYGELGYRQAPNSTFSYANGTAAHSNSQGFRGPEVQVPKGPGVFRILLLGGSTTHGWAVGDEETLDAHMRALLRKRYPVRTLEVVNLAFDGYDSYQIVERLGTDGLRLDPDLIIINAGINDVRNAIFPDLQDPDARTLLYRISVDSLEGGTLRKLFWLAKHHLYTARIPTLLQKARFSIEFERSRSRIEANEEAAEYFGRNLFRIVNLVSARQIPILFSSPPSSLTTKYEPTDSEGPSYWLNTAAETNTYRELLAWKMKSAADTLTSKQYPAAYLKHELPPHVFLDSCHLNAEGYEMLARAILAAAQNFLPKPLVRSRTPEEIEGGRHALE